MIKNQKNEDYDIVPELRYRYQKMGEFVSMLTIVATSLEKAQKEIEKVFKSIEEDF